MREPAWMTNAYAEIGLAEKTGAVHEPRVVQLFADSGNAWVKDDETAWCGAFVGAMFARAGRPDVRPPGEKANALRAREWLKVGRPTEEPRSGDIVIFWRGNPNASTGHVGFYAGETDKSIKVLGGNQSNAVNISLYPKSRVLGFRRVAEAAPAPAQPPPPSRRPEPSQAIPEPEDATRGDDRPMSGFEALLRRWFPFLFRK